MRNKKLFSFVIGLAFLFSALGLAFAPSSALAETGEEWGLGELTLAKVTAGPGDYLSGDAIPPYPYNPDPDNYSAYLIGEKVSDEITVTFIIEAGNAKPTASSLTQGTAFRKEFQVSLTGPSDKTITSVLMAVDADPSNGLALFDTSGNPFGPASKELKKVVLSGSYSATWEAGKLAFDGWEYRINDLFPTEPTEDGLGYQGPYPYDTPVYDGDIVHFFYDIPADVFGGSGNLAANYVRAKYGSFDSTNKKLTVQLQGHKLYIEPTDYILDVFNYVNLGSGMIASLYAADGSTLLQAGQPSWADGTVTFTNNSLAPGKYVVKTVPAYYYTTSTLWARRVNTAYFTQTGAYSEITIP
jgi:hypothetical protein